ncbi:MAG TPA: substrate-binding domain-containing protein [Atribacteraceae bacterium]|nr:substrate-binding domain-containing protein [Atribacteraceae bacterium]
MFFTKKTFLIVMVMSLAILLVGGIGSALAETIDIWVVVHGGIADPFWRVVERGVMDAADNYPDLNVTYTGPPVFDFVQFLAFVETAIAADPDVLVVTLTEPEAMDEVLRTAIAGGLPVIGINAPDLREPADARIPVLTYVGEDSYFIGVAAARETLARFTPRRAVYVNHHPGARNIELRGAGFVDTMREAGVPAEQLDITVDPVMGAEITLAYLQANPDTDVIFSGNTLRTETIVTRLLDEGIAVGEEVKIAQMDISEKILEYIQDGLVMFTMDQQQYMQGYLGVVFAYLHAKFGLTPPPTPVSTGPSVITADDIPYLLELAEKGFR